MICNECRQEFKGVVCRPCQAARTRRAMLKHQRRFLSTWLAGQIDLRVKRLEDGVRHLELFDDRWHSYCDKTMFGVAQRDFVKDLPADLCAECSQVFRQLVDEASVEL